MKLRAVATSTEGRSIWRCSTCGRQDVWSDGWLWLGNYRDGIDKVTCPACRPANVTILDVVRKR